MRNLIFSVSISLFSLFCYAQDTQNCRCCSEKYEEFNFWIGSWDVTLPDGSFAGKNVIDKIQDNCVLRENWTSANGNYTGTSSNFYNSEKKQWEQLWIDNQGGSLHLKGNRIGNQMILRTDESLNDKGEPFYHRVTWTLNDDGTVRQYWETITNNTQVTVAFDGLYKKTTR